MTFVGCRSILTLVALAAASGCTDVPEPPAGTSRSATSNQPPAVTAPVDSRGVVLPSPSAATVPQGSSVDAARLAAALQGLDGPGSIEMTSTEGGDIRGRVGMKTVEFRASRGLIVIRDERSHDVQFSEVPDEARLFARAQPVLEALGADQAEMVWKLGALGVRGGEGRDPSWSQARVETKLYIERIVAGIPVVEDRLVISFALDGTLRKVIGKWRALEGTSIRMQKAWTAAEIIERGVATVEARGQTKRQRLAPGEPLRISTRLVPEPAGQGRWSLALAGRVGITIHGPQGPTKPEELDFPL